MTKNKDNVVAVFDGYFVTQITDLTGYYSKSYDNLMPVWVKFRDLKFDYVRKKNDYLMHDKHRTLIANTITHGTIKEAFDELVKGIEWYNSLNSKL